MVAKFIEEKGYKQKVLLMGGTVAAEKYGVTSYPTSFLLDRNGVVVDYEMGFSEEHVADMESDIVALLK